MTAKKTEKKTDNKTATKTKTSNKKKKTAKKKSTKKVSLFKSMGTGILKYGGAALLGGIAVAVAGKFMDGGVDVEY